VTRTYQRLTTEKRREIIRLSAQGAGYREVMAKVHLSEGTIRAVLRPYGGVLRRELYSQSGRHLSVEERIEIGYGLRQGCSLRAIARTISRYPSTVSREVKANGGRCNYTPIKADRLARERARRPKAAKLASNPALRARVIADLEALWSPEQISRRLRLDFGHDSSMQLSHETIYQSLYVQGRGELRRELARCLRSGRAKRVPRKRMATWARIPDMVMISERPPEAEDRAVPGHWEGDLLMGKDNKSAIGTLVERSTRFVMLFSLPSGMGAEPVRNALTETIQSLPDALKRTLTWDQGREMAHHTRFRIDTGVQVYFCDPHSPWQRGSNENTNGLLRQFFPKGMSLANVTDAQLKRAADLMNGRPRETLGWATPAEKLADVLR
jgi:IS30 family transposase